jgi:hypothetical protein
MTTPSRDQDIYKDATEDERPSTTTNAPGLETKACRTMTRRSRSAKRVGESAASRPLDDLISLRGIVQSVGNQAEVTGI